MSCRLFAGDLVRDRFDAIPVKEECCERNSYEKAEQTLNFLKVSFIVNIVLVLCAAAVYKFTNIRYAFEEYSYEENNWYEPFVNQVRLGRG